MKETNLPKALEIINKLNKAENLSFKTKINLQAPKITDKELELIGKMDTSALTSNK